MYYLQRRPAPDKATEIRIDPDFKGILVFGTHSGKVLELEHPPSPWIHMCADDEEGTRSERYFLYQQDKMCAIYCVAGTEPDKHFRIWINREADIDIVIVDDGEKRMFTRYERKSQPAQGD